MKRRTMVWGGAAAVGAGVAGLLSMEPVGSIDGGPGSQDGSPDSSPAAGPPRPADPLRDARRAVRRAPRDPVAWSVLADAEMARARSTLETDRLDAAEEALRRSLSLKGEDNYPATTGTGRLANARHEFTEGRKWGLRSRRMAPDRSAAYGVLADAEIQLGNYGAARTAVQRMLDLAPDTAAYSRAAYDLETHGRPRDAMTALERAARAAQTPDETAFVEARLGALAWSRGELRQARRHFVRALDVVPHHPHATCGLARVHAARGRTAKATRTYDRLTARTPLPQFLLQAAEWKLAGPGRKAKAATELAGLSAQVDLLRAQGGPVDPHLALYAADHGEPATAVELMRKEWRQSQSVIVADALGWALHRAGRDAEALTYARSAARTDWQNPLFHYHRGVIELRLGHQERGDRLLRRALRLNPHFSPYHAPRARRLLDGDAGPHTTGEEKGDAQ